MAKKANTTKKKAAPKKKAAAKKKAAPKKKAAAPKASSAPNAELEKIKTALKAENPQMSDADIDTLAEKTLNALVASREASSPGKPPSPAAKKGEPKSNKKKESFDSSFDEIEKSIIAMENKNKGTIEKTVRDGFPTAQFIELVKGPKDGVNTLIYFKIDGKRLPSNPERFFKVYI